MNNLLFCNCNELDCIIYMEYCIKKYTGVNGMYSKDFITQLNRIKLATGRHTQRDLAAFLGVSPTAFAAARQRGKIPPEWLLTLVLCKGINPEWILAGNGACHIAGMARDAGTYETPESTADEAALRRLSSRALAEELLRRISL